MKLCFVLSQGGHLMESTIIADGLSGKHQVFFITDSDREITVKDYKVYRVKSFLRNPFRVFITFLQTLKIFITERPDVVISTGAEVSLPAFFIAKFFFRLPLVYVETCNQVFRPSMTGRITYHLADMFLVQWEPLLKCYGPKARYRGSFV